MATRVTVGFEVITPADAAKWLDEKAPNRSLKPEAIARYVADMAAGKWRATHQGIAFDESGCLIDGQNRLEAVVQAGVPVEMMVTRSLPREYQADLDQGSKRSVGDAVTMRLGTPNGRHLVAVANAMARGVKDMVGAQRGVKTLSVEQTLSWLETYGEAVQFAGSFTPQIRGLRHASIWGAVARAYLHTTPAVLTRFATTLVAPKEAMELGPWPEGGAAVLLNQFVLSGAGSNRAATIFRKSERALYSCIHGEQIKKLYETTYELFPLPGEEAP